MTPADRLIVALDVPTVAAAYTLVERLDGVVDFFKVGPWLLYSEGVDGLISALLAAKKRVFLDAKLHDVGRTVEAGVARAAERGVTMITVHGEPQVMAAAVRGRGRSSLRVFAVSVLTSLDDAGLRDAGYALSVRLMVQRRARLAALSGCDGLIASAADDLRALRSVAGAPLLLATPGIRGADDPPDDQARTATAADAIARGADYLVVGSPIIRAPDPALRARRLLDEMRDGEGQDR